MIDDIQITIPKPIVSTSSISFRFHCAISYSLLIATSHPGNSNGFYHLRSTQAPLGTIDNRFKAQFPKESEEICMYVLCTYILVDFGAQSKSRAR